MSRRSNQKLKILYLYRILTEQTDERRALTLSQIAEELSKYGVEAGRKCLYDDIEVLRVYGLNVCTKRDRYVRYYLKDKKFDNAEIKLLSDLVFQNDLLTARKKKELIKKFEGFTSLSDALIYDEDIPSKTISEDAYKNIELICRAIIGDKRITFKQFEWNAHKQRILLCGGEVIAVSPWKLEFYGNSYRLIAFDHSKKEIAVFLPSKLLNLTLTSKKRGGEDEFLSYISDDSEWDNIRLSCDNSVASDIIDRFGTDVTILANRENCFEMSAKTQINNDLFAWIFTMRGTVRILAPEWVAKRYGEMLIDGG